MRFEAQNPDVRTFYVEHSDFSYRPLRLGDSLRALQLRQVHIVRLLGYDEATPLPALSSEVGTDPVAEHDHDGCGCCPPARAHTAGRSVALQVQALTHTHMHVDRWGARRLVASLPPSRTANTHSCDSRELLHNTRPQPGSSSAIAGRTATRAGVRKVQMRWHGGTDLAAERLRQDASAISSSGAQRQSAAWTRSQIRCFEYFARLAQLLSHAALRQIPPMEHRKRTTCTHASIRTQGCMHARSRTIALPLGCQGCEAASQEGEGLVKAQMWLLLHAIGVLRVRPQQCRGRRPCEDALRPTCLRHALAAGHAGGRRARSRARPSALVGGHPIVVRLRRNVSPTLTGPQCGTQPRFGRHHRVFGFGRGHRASSESYPNSFRARWKPPLIWSSTSHSVATTQIELTPHPKLCRAQPGVGRSRSNTFGRISPSFGRSAVFRNGPRFGRTRPPPDAQPGGS